MLMDKTAQSETRNKEVQAHLHAKHVETVLDEATGHHDSLLSC